VLGLGWIGVSGASLSAERTFARPASKDHFECQIERSVGSRLETCGSRLEPTLSALSCAPGQLGGATVGPLIGWLVCLRSLRRPPVKRDQLSGASDLCALKATAFNEQSEEFFRLRWLWGRRRRPGGAGRERPPGRAAIAAEIVAERSGFGGRGERRRRPIKVRWQTCAEWRARSLGLRRARGLEPQLRGPTCAKLTLARREGGISDHRRRARICRPAGRPANKVNGRRRPLIKMAHCVCNALPASKRPACDSARARSGPISARRPSGPISAAEAADPTGARLPVAAAAVAA